MDLLQDIRGDAIYQDMIETLRNGTEWSQPGANELPRKNSSPVLDEECKAKSARDEAEAELKELQKKLAVATEHRNKCREHFAELREKRYQAIKAESDMFKKGLAAANEDASGPSDQITTVAGYRGLNLTKATLLIPDSTGQVVVKFVDRNVVKMVAALPDADDSEII